jgi:hypothetical protein
VSTLVSTLQGRGCRGRVDTYFAAVYPEIPLIYQVQVVVGRYCRHFLEKSTHARKEETQEQKKRITCGYLNRAGVYTLYPASQKPRRKTTTG